MREGEGLAGTLLIEDVTAISAVVLPIHEAKRGAAAHADI